MVPETNIENLIRRLDQLSTQLKSLSPINPEYQKKLDEKFRMEFNYNSNHMEGNTLTYGETKVLLIFGETSGNHNVREFEEMKAHDVAYKLVEQWSQDKERPLTEQNIKNLNRIILVEPFWNNAITPDGQPTRRRIKIGDYKEHPNSVILQNGEMFEYVSPMDTPAKMQELMEWYRKKELEMHPLELATLFHYQFVRIHPFDDGNGRIARLLMNFILLRNDLPPIVIKSNDKKNYLRVLHLADVGEFTPLIEYMGQQLEWSLDIYLKGAKGESIEEEHDLEKEIDIWKKKLRKTNKAHVIQRNSELVTNTYKESIKPLLESFLQEYTVFDDLFIEKRINIKLNDKHEQNNNLELFNRWIHYAEQQIKTQKKDMIDKDPVLKMMEPIFKAKGVENEFDNLGNVKELELHLYYHGFKENGVNTFDETAGIKVVFNDLNYVVMDRYQQRVEYFTKLYSEKITKEEIAVFIKDMVRDTFNKIQVSVDRNNK